jgi:hypothetical protein
VIHNVIDLESNYVSQVWDIWFIDK